jgi:hypothetical protein
LDSIQAEANPLEIGRQPQLGHQEHVPLPVAFEQRADLLQKLVRLFDEVWLRLFGEFI